MTGSCSVLGANDLNGSTRHLKLDANADFSVDAFYDLNYHPRGDFNGDGKLDEDSARFVPGWNQSLTDLEVLAFSELEDVWEDPNYDDASVLFDLVNSVDFHVSATNFYYKHTDIDAEVDVSVYDVETEAPLEDGAAITFYPDSSEHIFTVPTDGEYFVASDPIPIGEGTNVVMRSIGNQEIADSQRGADFAVDLALWEMTAVARMLNPETNLIDSRALAKYVEAYIPAGGTAQPEADGIGRRPGLGDQHRHLLRRRSRRIVPDPPYQHQLRNDLVEHRPMAAQFHQGREQEGPAVPRQTDAPSISAAPDRTAPNSTPSRRSWWRCDPMTSPQRGNRCSSIARRSPARRPRVVIHTPLELWSKSAISPTKCSN